MLGVIGGSGLYRLPELDVIEKRSVSTPFGMPSDDVTIGRLHRQEIVFLPRHGGAHQHTPSELPYRANIYALKELGVTHVVSVAAVGSLRESLPPLSVVLPDQIIDRTMLRDRSFFGDGAVAHVGLADPFCAELRKALALSLRQTDALAVDSGCYLCIEGPQFSTKAESHLYRSWGASVIGMTAMPEARLAREAELCYAAIALVTDFDVWHESQAPVTVEMVVANLHRNAATAQSMIVSLAQNGLPERTCSCGDALAHAFITAPSNISDDTKRRLGVIAARYLDASQP